MTNPYAERQDSLTTSQNMAERDAEIGFKKETVSKLLSSFFKEDKTRQAAVRSQKQAESEDCDQVDIEHFEKILPQLLLDF
ncbi:centromere protein X isoform X2 [Dicentrarchus labrax]|uniref:centromere protein X isoform X2 n=1 Tax=Dicentrarchus labrax TaxID=13489 RepID=UPI0021F5FAA9|nr:centromere protein X isoform X2 [Dicentrarchus labrax]